jgi:hypothetical protein
MRGFIGPFWSFGIGDPGMTRTCDLRFRKPSLYPAELRDRINDINDLSHCGVFLRHSFGTLNAGTFPMTVRANDLTLFKLPSWPSPTAVQSAWHTGR